MTQEEFAARYKQEKPMYEAWADFVLSEIKSGLLNLLGNSKPKYDEYVKMTPSSRVKTTESLLTKAFIRKKDKYQDPYSQITDKAGIRFVVLLTQQLDQLCSIIENHKSWTYSKDKEFDEWRTSDPRMFDYQSVHYIVRAQMTFVHKGVTIDEDTPCEVQFRTLLQHAYAELAHDTIYKGDVDASPTVKRCFAKSMALMETTDELLCGAKAELEKCAGIITQWREVALSQASKLLPASHWIDDTKNIEFYLSEFQPLLSTLSIDDLLEFLGDHEYSFLASRIESHQNNKAFVEFKLPVILVCYFLAKKKKSVIKKYWPTDFHVLQIIFNDLGLAPNWATH
ncbi:GTP pyrophosphokinase [Vibrio diazotrophicus]|uniref:PpGpp synthetase/RelA/SpoT-type nucleotidyltransferase n=1 Tax=Vibrio diazotrophicus TaxID=685 RepID=A0A329DYJ9_VIBDI|nr:(p)ppGpp synthetase [Vibrio diazotrophicus]RAS51973.1 ppGpp synthetase/RelA/SpoT-type nucleotidyltransferase [Vibrio diazotrophicus]